MRDDLRFEYPRQKRVAAIKVPKGARFIHSVIFGRMTSEVYDAESAEGLCRGRDLPRLQSGHTWRAGVCGIGATH